MRSAKGSLVSGFAPSSAQVHPAICPLFNYLGEGFEAPKRFYSGSILARPVVIVHASAALMRLRSWPAPQESL